EIIKIIFAFLRAIGCLVFKRPIPENKHIKGQKSTVKAIDIGKPICENCSSNQPVGMESPASGVGVSIIVLSKDSSDSHHGSVGRVPRNPHATIYSDRWQAQVFIPTGNRQ